MINNLKINYIEVTLATLILALSSIQTIKTFSELYPGVFTRNISQFEPLKIQNSYVITSSSAKNPGCLGYLESDYDRTLDNAFFSLKGEVFLAFNTSIVPTKVDLEATFNALGQLAAGILKLNSAAGSLTVGLLNVDPIDITFFASQSGSKPYSNKLSIPGPIFLKQLSDNFFIEYGQLNKSIALTSEQPLLKNLFDLDFKKDSYAQASCLAGDKSSFDLINFSSKLKEKISPIFPIPLPENLLNQIP